MVSLKSFRIAIAASAGFLISAVATSASAATILAVEAGDDNAPIAIGPGVGNEGAAAGFTLGADYLNVTISIDFTFVCAPICDGDVLLYQGTPGPGAPPSNLIAFDTFDGSASTIGFSNLPSLESGDYFLIVGLRQGGLVWLGSDSPNVGSDGISSNNADLLIDDVSLTSFLISTFIAYDGFLHFSITGDLALDMPHSEIPLPASAFLFLGGLGWLARISRR